MIANVAIARELAGWCWSLAVHARLTPSGHRPDLVGPQIDGAQREEQPASRGYEQPTPELWRRSTLDPRNSSCRTARSCGNQPAHISLDHASRNDTLTSTSIPPRSSPIPVPPIAATALTSSSPPSRPSPCGVGPCGPSLDLG